VSSRALHICLINRNFPPQKGATGYYASHLVHELRKNQGHRVQVVTIGEGVSTDSVSYVKPIYQGRIKVRRLVSAYRESRNLLKAAIKSDPDVYIVMTDPALLNYWASKLLRGKVWICWSMDLFPEGFEANGLTSKNSLVYRKYQSVLRKGAPDFILALGKEQLANSSIAPSSIVVGSPPSLIWACVTVKLKEKMTQINADFNHLWSRQCSLHNFILGFVFNK